MWRSGGFVVGLAMIMTACGGSADPEVAPFVAEVVDADDCIVRLHGKGGNGAASTVTDGVAELWPSGNANGWGGRQWIYFSDAELNAGRAVLTDAIDPVGCERVVLSGFSNGAAFLGKLLCSGETLGGRLLGVVIDDPVPDLGVASCAPDPSVDVALYWTGKLEDWAPDGTKCSGLDWTCEGGEVTSIDTYAASVGATVTASPLEDHDWFLGAPEPSEWLAADEE